MWLIPRRSASAARRWFRRVPERWKRRLVRLATPGHTVGSVVVLRREGRVLVVRQDHATGWSLPGGLLHKGETARDGLRREVSEELGDEAWRTWVAVIPSSPTHALHDPVARRVDLIFDTEAQGAPTLVPGRGIHEATWVGLDADMGNQTTTDILRALGYQGVSRGLDGAGLSGRVSPQLGADAQSGFGVILRPSSGQQGGGPGPG